MQNNLLLIIFIFVINFNLLTSAKATESFNFDVTKIEILENGNKVVGKNRGKISSNDGITISANNFIYYKDQNILNASGNVVVKDDIKNFTIFSENITYNKNKESIFSKGLTKSEIYSRYSLDSTDLLFSKNKMTFESDKNTKIIDNKNNTLYNLNEFNFDTSKELLKGKKILVNTNFNLPQSDKFYFKSGIFNFKEKSFIAKDVEIKIKKNIFDNLENDPRLKGVSANSKNNITTVNKGTFTSCKKNNDDCPPWIISADKIRHNKEKKRLIYDKALLKIYNVPVLYFPKFFHPDPSVERQSGLLKPQLNNSNTLGSSFNIPYYHVIADNMDFTFRPSIFENDIKMFQNEYRQVNENSYLSLDFGYVDNYKSSLSNKKNSISHLFAEFDTDLKLKNFTNSKFFLSIQKVTNDTYLKVFDSNLFKNKLIPNNYDVLNSEAKLTLDNENYNFTTGFQSFENLQLKSSDRYQFILPYYNFDTQIFKNFQNGFVNFSSQGSNDLNNTNNLKTRVINDLNFNSLDLISSKGFKSNYNVFFKNLNTTATNDTRYKSSAQTELMSIFELNTILPMIKENENTTNYLTPKISLRVNPGDMKDYSNSERKVNVNNIFEINRLGIDDSFEEGKSLTVGLDFKKTDIVNINKFFETKIATVYRENEESFIPLSSGINKKNSSFFGNISNNFSESININYDFILNDDLKTLEYNSLSTTLNYKNITTEISFIEESGDLGNINTLANNTKIAFNDENYLLFNTRRNREINLTEFYDLIYEYKNDCLVAGIKYNKTYYEDRDLKPSENLLFSITLTPLTSFEQKIDQ